MTKKQNIVIGSVALVLMLITWFLPIVQMSFIGNISGYKGFFINFFRLFNTDSYFSYLKIIFTCLTPILAIVLAIWIFKDKIKTVPLLLLSGVTCLGAIYWLFKYGGMGILLIGYYFWLTLVIAITIYLWYRTLSKKELST